MRCSGPYTVIKKHNKYFILNSEQVPEAVSIERLKRFVESNGAEDFVNAK